MQDKNTFLFLYPQEDVLDFEIRNHSWNYESLELDMEFEAEFKDLQDKDKLGFGVERLRERYSREAVQLFRPIYSRTLNQAIDLRYRQKGFRIFYALLDDKKISEVIQLQPTDKIIYVGMDEKTHRTPDINGKYPYPDRDFILDQLENVNRLVVSGFHLNDCVKKVARRAHAKGMNVLVDEELTELFGWQIKRQEFDPSCYPSINPRGIITSSEMFEYFLQRRRRQPWLYNWDSISTQEIILN